jgi:hypothetical protein
MAKSRTKKPMRYGAPTCATFSGQCAAREQVDGEKRAPWLVMVNSHALTRAPGAPATSPRADPVRAAFFKPARRGRADEGSCT